MLYQMQPKYNNAIFSHNISDTNVTNDQTILKKLKPQFPTKLTSKTTKYHPQAIQKLTRRLP